jgi:hypothetical protein
MQEADGHHAMFARPPALAREHAARIFGVSPCLETRPALPLAANPLAGTSQRHPVIPIRFFLVCTSRTLIHVIGRTLGCRENTPGDLSTKPKQRQLQILLEVVFVAHGIKLSI